MCAFTASATIFNCSRAAGRYTSTETSRGRCPPALNQFASLPEVVVLPEPCNPAMSTTVGGCEANFMRAVSLPRISTSSSRTILMTCSPGDSAVSTSWPTALARIWSMSCFTTLKLTSASSSARRISRSASSMFSSVSLACPRRLLNARCSFSCKFSNIGVSQHFNSRSAGLRYRQAECCATPRSQLSDFRSYHLESLPRPCVLDAAHAADQVKRIAVELAIFHVRVIDVNRDNLANHKATAGGSGRKIKNLIELAFKADWRPGDS